MDHTDYIVTYRGCPVRFVTRDGSKIFELVAEPEATHFQKAQDAYYCAVNHGIHYMHSVIQPIRHESDPLLNNNPQKKGKQ